MATLLGILDTAGARDEIGKDMARNMASKLIMPWSEEFRLSAIKLGYDLYASMDYENMNKMPEKINFIFDPSGKYFEHYFPSFLDREHKITLPGQPNENLTRIVLGKRPVWTKRGEDIPIEDSVYIYIQSGAARMPGRIKAVKGNEQISEPILYASIRDHIEILLPKNLTYFK